RGGPARLPPLGRRLSTAPHRRDGGLDTDSPHVPIYSRCHHTNPKRQRGSPGTSPRWRFGLEQITLGLRTRHIRARSASEGSPVVPSLALRAHFVVIAVERCATQE